MSLRRLLQLATAALAVNSATALASPCPTDNVITDPPQFAWTYHPVTANNAEPYYSGTMEIGEASFVIGGETLTTRAYRQAGTEYSIPGPTMSVEPGSKYILSFHNTLPYEAPSTEHNVFKDPQISNVHTHGLHISGESPSDDVTRSFEGGFGGDFVYDIPADHMGGTYWYHAHHHGSTFLQVSGGAFGQMIVDDQWDGIPANVAAMDERQLVVAFLDTAAAGTGGDTLLSGTLSPTWTVNGTVQGNVCAPQGEWEHWRVLLADRNAMEKTVAVGPECEVALMARDGVWRTTAPKALPTNSISLTGASRADLAVRCSADSTLTVNGNVVANVYVDGAGDTSVHPYAADGGSTWSAIRPDYLRDLRGETDVNTETVRMGARTVNGSKYDHMTPTFSLPADQVQEWTVHGAANHPFHLHVYHMQTLNCGGDYEDGEYYDIVASNCSVRFDLNAATASPFEGKTIMHCHILSHEDQGAMGWMDVLGGELPPYYPADGDIGTAYSEYYALGGQPPVGDPPADPSDLLATAFSSSAIDLTWADNSSDEDGFEIERSLDGVTFEWVDTVGADVTSFTDTGLAADTTYDYRVLAFNLDGASGFTNVATDTTLPATAGTSVQVGSITVTTVSAARGQKAGRAVIAVVDDQGSAVQGAVVSGEFTGTFTETVSASTPTDAAGSTTVDTAGSAKGGVTVTFCVTGISHPSLQDFSAAPGQVCGSL